MNHHSKPVIRLLAHPTTLAVIVLSALWVIFFWRLWTPTAEDRVIFQKGDFPLHYFAYSDYQVERMWDGDIPLWNPYNYGGDPFAANVQWAVWYPPRWIAALVAGSGGWDIEALQFEVAAHYWLVSLMMYAFLRVVMGDRQVGAIHELPLHQKTMLGFPPLLGAILWTYGGYLTGYPMLQASILESIAWLPLMLLGAHLSITKTRWRVRGILLAGVMMAISFFGGHTQTTMQMTYFAAAYIAFFGWRNRIPWRGIAGRIALLGISGAALAAVQLIPALELARLSYRAETYHYAEKATGYTAPELAQVIWPHLFSAEYWPLYLGVAGLLLAAAAIQRDPKRHAFWIGTIIVTLWLAMGGYSMVYDVFYLFVPGFSTFREQERVASLAVFALVVLATDQIAFLLRWRGYGATLPQTHGGELSGAARELAPRNVPQLDSPFSARVEGSQAVEVTVPDTARPAQSNFRHEDQTPSLRPVGRGSGGGVNLARAHLILTALVFLVITVILNVTHEHAIPDDLAHAVGLVALVSLLFNGWLIWFRRERHALIPAALLVIIVVDLFSFGMHSPNFVEDNPFNRIQPPDHLDLLQQPTEDIRWHVDGAAGIQSYGTYWRIPDIYGTGPFRLTRIEKLRQIRVDRRWEVFAVRYATMIADAPDNVPVEIVGEGVNYDGQEYVLYELTDPRPFAHLVYDALSFDDPDAAREFMVTEPYIDLREIALAADDLPFDLPGERPPNPAANAVIALSMTEPEYIEMQVSSEENALLTLPIANYPGWEAQVNGRDVDIIDTYGGLIGIPITAGADQIVTLHFVPQTVIWGAIISGLALVVVLGYVVVSAIRARLNRRGSS